MQGNRIFTTKFYILGNFKLALNLIDITCKSTCILYMYLLTCNTCTVQVLKSELHIEVINSSHGN